MQPPAPLTRTSASAPSSNAPGNWLSPGRFAIILGLLIFAFFPQVLLGLETFVVRDYGFFAYPLAHFQQECFWRGEFPLWNPYNSCGVPFLAQWNTMPLYPPALVYLLLPLSWSLSFFCLLHLFWAGLGMYVLAYHWTGNRLAASVAGLMFAFNGFTLNLLMWPSHIATLSWMAWVVWSVERAWKEGGRTLPLAALTGALQMLAGGPETILFTWLILVGLWLMQLAPAPKKDSEPGAALTPVLWRLPLVAVLVAGLAAAQLLPFLDLVAHSQREQGYADARWSLPTWGWANFLVPMVFGNTWKQDLFFQYGQYWTSSYYLGIGGMLLAFLALWRARDRRVWFLVFISALGYVVACGDGLAPSRWLRHAIPQLSLITYPVKFITPIIFSAPLLAAFALGHILPMPSSLSSAGGEGRGEEASSPTTFMERRPLADCRLWLLTGFLLLLIGAILLWAWRWPFPRDDFPATLRNGLSRAAFLVIITALLTVIRKGGEAVSRAPMLSRILPLVLLLCLWGDVRTHEPNQNPSVPDWIYTPGLARKELEMNPQPELGVSRVMLTREASETFTQLVLADPKGNFLVKRIGYFADCNLLDSVPKVNGFFSLYPRECGELNSAIYGSTNPVPLRLADFLGVSQLTTPGTSATSQPRDMWQARSNYLPFVTAGQRPVFLSDDRALPFLIGPDFDGAKYVFLPPEAGPLVSQKTETRARVALKRLQAEQVDIEVEAAEPTVVVLSQTYYHRWHAYIDGQRAPLLRANYAFQAVPAPAGKHQLRLVYEDAAFHFGAGISLTALVGLAAAWFVMSAKIPSRRA